MSSRNCASLGSSLMHSGRTPTMRAARMCALWLWSLRYTVARSGCPAALRRRHEGVDAGRRAATSQQIAGAKPSQRRRNQSITTISISLGPLATSQVQALTL